jgi:hypothetical protein
MGRIGIYPLVPESVPKALSPSQDCHGEIHAADNTACVLSIGEQFWWVPGSDKTSIWQNLADASLCETLYQLESNSGG